MAKEQKTSQPQAASQDQAPAQERSPVLPLNINLQYIRDLSFEVPHGAAIFPTLKTRPEANVSIDVRVIALSPKDGIYEVAMFLRIDATDATPQQAAEQEKKKAKEDKKEEPRKVFICELTYCGVVTLHNPPKQLIEPLLFVEVPRLMFPYARNILSDATRDGGFPPVVIQPIDFVAFWKARRAQQEAAQKKEQEKSGDKKSSKDQANVSSTPGHA